MSEETFNERKTYDLPGKLNAEAIAEIKIISFEDYTIIDAKLYAGDWISLTEDVYFEKLEDFQTRSHLSIDKELRSRAELVRLYVEQADAWFDSCQDWVFEYLESKRNE